MADGSAITAVLARVEAELDAVGHRLTAEARPPASVLEHCSALVTEAHAALAAANGGTATEDAAQRLELVRTAVRVKRKLQVVARLVAGSAWYAALARELEGASNISNTTTYGRQGAGTPSPAPSSIERRA